MAGYILLPLLFLSVQAMEVKEGRCNFPSYMYTGKNTWQNSPVFNDENNSQDIKEVWTMLDDMKSIRVQQYDHKEYSLFRYPDHFDTSKKHFNEYYLHCHSNPKGQDLVIVKRAEDNKVTYQCIGFEKRSDIVITFSISPQSSDAGSSLCEGELFLSPSPLVYFEISYDSAQNLESFMSGKSYLVCPLEGGFRLESVYSTSSKKECTGRYTSDEYSFRVLENDCERGEGISFHWPLHGPNDTCETYPTRMYCMASWRNDEYTFMFMSNRGGMSKGIFYCAKYLGHGGIPDDGIVYLFNGSICDYTHDLRLQQSYVRFKIRKMNTMGEGLCSDETEECQKIPQEKCIGHVKHGCAETCKYCPTPRPWESAEIDERFRGTFRRNSLLRGRETVNIWDKGLDIPQMGKFDVLAENVCKVEEDYGSFSNITNYLMLKKGNDKGCIPRVVILAIKEITPSVLLYKMSMGVNTHTSFPYPANEVKKTEDWNLAKSCRMAFFHMPPFKKLTNVFHYSADGWDVLIKQTPVANKTACGQKLGSVITFTLPQGATCTGNVKSRDSDTAFDVNIVDCSPVRNAVGKTSSYECMAVLHGRSKKDGEFVITKAIGGSDWMGMDYLCWALSEDGTSSFLVPIGNCYPALWFDVRFRNIQPLAILNKAFLTRSSAWITLLLIAITYFSIEH